MSISRYWPILTLTIIAIFLIPLWRAPFYQSHDGENHVARFAAYSKAFKDGSIPPRWAGDLNYRFGSPVLNFFYPLPGYAASFLHPFGISFQDTFKLISSIAFLAAPLFCYIWLRLLFRQDVALGGALLYGLAPYHFLDLYVRGDIAEIVALAVLPLVFWAITKHRVILGGIFYGLLILSHNGISLMFSPVLLFYALTVISWREWRKILYIFLIGLGLSCFFWFPAMLELRYTLGNVMSRTMFLSHFPTLSQLVYSSWGFGPDVAALGGLSPQIGPVHIFATIAGILVLLKHKRFEQRNQGIFWMIFFFVGAFLSLRISSLFWEYVPLLEKFQFPWRFGALTTFASVVLACVFLSAIKNKFINIAVCLIVFILSIPMAKVYRYVDKSDNFYMTFPGTTYYQGEAMTKWSAGDMGSFPGEPVEIISGQGTVTILKRTTTRHDFKSDSSGEMKILDNTLFYPGWTVIIDGRQTPIQFQDPNHRGLITFTVPQGKHSISVVFTETRLRLLADFVSLFTILAVTITWFFRKKAYTLGIPI